MAFLLVENPIFPHSFIHSVHAHLLLKRFIKVFWELLRI